MLRPDENGMLVVKTEQQYENIVASPRDDFCVLVLEVEGIFRKTTDLNTVLKVRLQRKLTTRESAQAEINKYRLN